MAKEIKARVQLKRDTDSNWGSASTGGFIPKDGEPIFYKNSNKIKIGDGERTPDELEFLKAEVDIPLQKGEGENSIQQVGTGAQALTEGTVALGEGTVSGSKGYYFTEIYFGSSTEKGQLRLSATPPTDTGFLMSQKALDPLSTFETPSYILDSETENDRKIYIICGDHYFFCATIESITNDIVTFTTDLLDLKTKFENYNANNADKQYSTIENGYFKLRAEEIILPDGTVSPVVVKVDDYTITVPAQPTVGVVDVGEVGTTFGYKTKATGFASLAEGVLTIAAVSYAHAEGRETVAGYAAHSEGQETEAIGHRSHAEGFHTIASGMAAHAEGSRALVNNEIIKVMASGMGAHAEGSGTHATEPAAHAEGAVTEATGEATHAEGKYTHATALAAHAEGNETTASEEAAHSEGYLCTSSGKYSHSEGISCTASGIAAHAEGNKSEASGDYSHAGGVGTKATYVGQYAIGRYNDVDNNALFIIGNGESDNDRTNAFKVYNSGNTVVSGTLTANKGIKSYVSAGQKAGTTLGSCATAEGNNTTSSGNSTHAEGSNTTASGNYSHAEGNRATASGVASHAEGSNTKAEGNFSHAAGEHTIAKAAHQTVIGKYNDDNAKALFIIGNGKAPEKDKAGNIIKEEVRSNAFEVISDNGKVSIKVGSTLISEGMPSVPDTTKEYIAKYIPGEGWVAVELSVYNGEVV